MITPLFLCLYLLFFVIDLVVWGVWTGSEFLLGLGGFHLVMFLVVVGLFRDEFYALAEKYQTRIVFSPRVFGFFSLASGLLFSAVVVHERFVYFLARGVLGALLLFWFGVRLFEFFPVKTRHVQRLLFWSSLLGIGSFLIVAWGSLGKLFVTNELPNVDQGQGINNQEGSSGTTIKTGIALNDIEDVFQTGTQLGTGTQTGVQDLSGKVVVEPVLNTGDIKLDSGSTIEDAKPITYRLLLPYLDAQGLLPAVNETPTFTFVPKQESIYKAFQRAWGLKMIGTNVNPDWQVRCENLMVLLGLANDRTVSKTVPLLDAYRQEARTKDALGSCLSREQVATQDMLRNIKKSTTIDL